MYTLQWKIANPGYKFTLTSQYHTITTQNYKTNYNCGRMARQLASVPKYHPFLRSLSICLQLEVSLGASLTVAISEWYVI